MAYVAVEKNGLEVMCSRKPYREKKDYTQKADNVNIFSKLFSGKWTDAKYISGHCLYRNSTKIVLPKGSIEKLVGRTLTWAHDPIKLV